MKLPKYIKFCIKLKFLKKKKKKVILYAYCARYV